MKMRQHRKHQGGKSRRVFSVRKMFRDIALRIKPLGACVDLIGRRS